MTNGGLEPWCPVVIIIYQLSWPVFTLNNPLANHLECHTKLLYIDRHLTKQVENTSNSYLKSRSTNNLHLCLFWEFSSFVTVFSKVFKTLVEKFFYHKRTHKDSLD